MKGTVAAAAVAALAGGVSAGKLHHRHAHGTGAAYGTGQPKLETGSSGCEQVCSTWVETYYGEPTLVGLGSAPTKVSSAQAKTTSTKEVVVVPTAAVETCPTPGTYTFPATTITLTETTTVCGASTTKVSPGTHTVGGVTTVVATSTTVVCPYATTSVDNSGVVTSVIKTTTYVCPSAGTYTIAPITTEVVDTTVIVIPVVETYTPGTYTRPEVVTTVTETDYVFVCPYTVSPVAESTSPAKTEKAETTATATASSSSSKATQSSSSSYSGGGLSGSGDHFAMTYTPYTSTGQCKSSSEVDSDISSIHGAGFSAIRVYSTDCDTLANVGSACEKYGVKMIVGIFINSGGCKNSNPSVDEQIAALAAWAKWDLVEAVVVGNEAIYNGYCTPSELAGIISTCKSKFSGFSGPFTTSEVLSVWQRTDVQSALCSVIDITGANIHPYFNSAVTPDSAGEFVAGQLELIDGICAGKSGVNLECGWPSAGVCNGSACPGKSEQATAIASIRSKAGSRTAFFSFHDDLWKENGSCQCEQHWGSGDLFA